MIKDNQHWLKSFNLLMFDDIDSTNTEAKRLLQAGVGGNFVIWAKSQTQGRGRHGRKWESLPGNLFFSMLLQSIPASAVNSELSFVTAVAVGEAMSSLDKSLTDVISYKWPNDVLCRKKKLSGILLESFPQMSLGGVVVGIGVNVAAAPNNVSYQVTSLNQEIGGVLDSGLVLDSIMKSFCYYYNVWVKLGFEVIRNKWKERACGVGEVMTVTTGGNRVSGIFNDLHRDGRAELSLPGGGVCLVSSGEIFYSNMEECGDMHSIFNQNNV